MEGQEGSGVSSPGEYACHGSWFCRPLIGPGVSCFLVLGVRQPSFCLIGARAARAIDAGTSAPCILEECMGLRADLCYVA